jgi:phthiocerol/phenolphthiocerol synthesis type-I polyketide synthase E
VFLIAQSPNLGRFWSRMNSTDPRQTLKEALRELQDLRRQMKDSQESQPEKVAIVGIGCRPPDGAGDGASGGGSLELLARCLPAGTDLEIQADLQWHQHLLLDTSWKALAHAGQPLAALPKSRTGVFIGMGADEPGSPGAATGAVRPTPVAPAPALHLAEAVAETFGFSGPVVNVTTDYAAALTAVHLARQSLLSGESDVALAGGVTLAASGQPLDAAGCSLVVLKRLSAARQERDYIWAVVCGSSRLAHAAGQEAWQAGLRQALLDAGITAAETDYFAYSHNGEAIDEHDVWQAIWRRLSDGSGRAANLAVSGARGGVGQADSVASLARALLVLQTGSSGADFYVGERPSAVKTALVSGFSALGQVHLFLEQPRRELPATDLPPYLVLLSARSEAALAHAARQLAAHLETRPESHVSDVAYTLRAGRSHLAWRRALLAGSREQLLQGLQETDYYSHSELTGKLGGNRSPEQSLTFLFPGLGNHHLNMGRELLERQPIFRAAVDRCAVLLQPHLGLDLRDLLYVEMDEQADGSGGPAGLDLRRMLARGNGAGRQTDGNTAEARLQETAVAQPILFTIEYALVQLLQSWGIRPAAVLGYSIGEYVAAHLAGVLSLADALFLVATRAQLIQALPPGRMLAVPLSEAEVGKRINGRLAISAVNGSDLCVVAGEPAAVDALASELAAEGMAARKLPTSHAFHTDLMRPIGTAFTEALRQVRLRSPQMPYVSNVTGDWITAAQATSPDYWLEHTCRPVRFGDGIATLRRSGHDLFLEVGPGQALTSLITSLARTHERRPGQAWPAMRYEYDRQPDTAVLYQAVAGLWLAGMPIDWEHFDVQPGTRRVPLPADPFDPVLLTPVGDHDALPLQMEDAREPQAAMAATAPVTANGSRALPAGEVEQKLYHIWRRVLKIGDFDPRRTFFELGGNSLLATQLIFQLRKTFQVGVSLRTIFEVPSIAGLAQVVHDQDSGHQPPLAAGQLADGSDTGFQEYELPNGLVVACQSRAETAHFYEDIFEHGSYVRHGIELPPGATVFDVGGNIGLFTLFAHLNCPGARIFTFEPAPPLFRLLQENVARHGVGAQLYPCALSSQAGTAALTFYPQSSGMSSLYPDLAEEKAALTAVLQNQVRRGQTEVEALLVHADDYLAERFRQETFTCPVKTVSQVIDETAVERLHLLKIDVQKSEYDVLLGIREEHWSRIDQIVLEVHDVEGRLHTISHLLRQKGYRVIVEQDDLYAGSTIYNVYARLKVES